MVNLIQTTQTLMEVEPHFSFNQEKLALYLDICTVFIYTNSVTSHQNIEIFYFLERNHLEKIGIPSVLVLLSHCAAEKRLFNYSFSRTSLLIGLLFVLTYPYNFIPID